MLAFAQALAPRSRISHRRTSMEVALASLLVQRLRHSNSDQHGG